MKLAIEKNKDSFDNLSSLREIASAVKSSITSIRQNLQEQDFIIQEMNEISQSKAASLQESSANSSSISENARSVYEELTLTDSAIKDLKLLPTPRVYQVQSRIL